MKASFMCSVSWFFKWGTGFWLRPDSPQTSGGKDPCKARDRVDEEQRIDVAEDAAMPVKSRGITKNARSRRPGNGR